MNTMGKILVFLNLLFALVVGGFLIIDFGMRKNWKKYGEALKNSLAVTKENATQLAQTKQKLMDELRKAHQKNLNLQVKLKATTDKYEEKLQAAAKVSLETGMAMKQSGVSQTVIQAEKERLTKEAELLREQKQQLEGIIVAMEKKQDQYLQLYQQALNDKTSIQTRNQALFNRLRKLEIELAKKQTGSTGGAAEIADRNTPNPPPFYIKGLINKVEPNEKNLVEITLGSDQGIKEGHTLEVYRLRPQPKYIGMIRIERVDPRSSVARVIRSGVFATNEDPRVNDEVASRIVPR